MLIKRKNFMASKSGAVKKLSVSLIVILGTCTAAIAPSAFANGYSPWVDQVVTVKFRVSDLQAEDGLQKVYTLLEKKAKAFCRADSHSLYRLSQTVADCKNDLVDQFVESADIAALKAYHLSKMSADGPMKFAQNKN